MFTEDWGIRCGSGRLLRDVRAFAVDNTNTTRAASCWGLRFAVESFLLIEVFIQLSRAACASLYNPFFECRLSGVLRTRIQKWPSACELGVREEM
jgi:hypothetical protein